MLESAATGATFLLNAPHGKDEVWSKLPREVQQQIVEKKLRFFVIDGFRVAKESGMGIAYAHCIAHGIDMEKGLDQQALAVDSAYCQAATSRRPPRSARGPRRRPGPAAAARRADRS